MDTLEKVLPRTIFLTLHGSHLYGTNIEGSDYDFKGVCIPTVDYFLGTKKFEQLERHANKGHPHDLTVIALEKFARLAADCNPNIIEILFADDASIVSMDVFGVELRAQRDAFISRRAKHTFSGYAHAQLKRIKTHRKWLLDPPSAKPERKDFDLGETTKISKSELGAFDNLKDIELPKEVLTLFLREKSYQAALGHWNQYENWKKTRNEARADLEAKFGYDTKHAMHLVRLMRMCSEILRTGEVIVKRPDAKELLTIRAGEWEYDEVIQHAESLELQASTAYETSPLCREPDRAAIDEFIVDLTQRYLSRT